MTSAGATPSPAPATSSRWLIFSYASNQDGMACAQHLDDRLPFLRRAGIEPLLVTGICGVPWTTWTQVRVPSLAPSGVRFESRYWVRRRVRPPWLVQPVRFLLTLICLPFYLLEKLVLNVESQWSWFALAASAGMRLYRNHQPSLIYSTGGSASAHVAAALVSRRTGLPWIAEFQDPLVYPGLRRSRRSIRTYAWVERLVARRAACVVFLTEEARRRFAQRTGVPHQTLAIHPGADPARLPSLSYTKNPTCEFAHFGTLSGSRTLKTFLEALRGVWESHPAWRQQITVHLYGHMDGAMRALIENFPSPQVITDHGRLPRPETLAAMRRAEVLLLVQNAGPISAETIPSKLYEYAFTSRPILALIDGNPELASMLTSHGHFVADLGDLPGMQDAICRLVRHWEQGFGSWRPTAPFPFTVERAVAQLIAATAAGQAPTENPAAS